MQQRRYRPGDVLDDYCPRERRITNHAIVAMIDDHIKQTRCVVCDAEHEYKDGKVPPQRRKKPQAALFAQVLDGLQGPQPAARMSAQADVDTDTDADEPLADDTEATVIPATAHATSDRAEEAGVALATGSPSPVVVTAAAPDDADDAGAPRREEGLWRRQLIRAALPRPEGQPPPQIRPATDFTVRQPSNNRPQQRHGSPRRGGGQGQGQGLGGNHGPMRFGRSAPGSGAGQGQGSGRSRRRGKKR